jgi:hypothetical protein
MPGKIVPNSQQHLDSSLLQHLAYFMRHSIKSAMQSRKPDSFLPSQPACCQLPPPWYKTTACHPTQSRTPCFEFFCAAKTRAWMSVCFSLGCGGPHVHELQKYCRSKSMYIWASACTCWYPVWQIPIRGVGAMEVVGHACLTSDEISNELLHVCNLRFK